MEDRSGELNRPCPSLMHLFLAFFKLGATAFGGPAIVAYMRQLAVNQKRWLDEKTARDGIALCQTIPGATAMQMSAYVGFRARGIGGAAVSFIGFGLPAFLLMMILSAFYAKTHTLPSVVSIFNGLQAIVVAIVAYATFSFGRPLVKTWQNGVLALTAAALFGLKLHPILVISFAAFLGVALYFKQPVQLGEKPPTKSSPPPSLLWLIFAALLGTAALFRLNRRLFDLAMLMFRIDLFAFGGGYASVPMMFHEVVEVRRWMDGPTLLNGIALGQVTPGPIVITATFIGYLWQGFWGGVVATASVFLPSFLIVIGAIPYFDRIRSSPHLIKVFTGIFCSFVGLLLTVTFRFAIHLPWDLPRLLITLGALAALFLKVGLLWVVLLGAGVSWIVL
ncbi:MAG: chromate efflux transporter [Desulfobacterota bacterium]|nr:chromate efflux transporter [Thermodesulfobacteriota bacterium]